MAIIRQVKLVLENLMSFNIFDENTYLSNNPDVKAAINAKVVSSGLEHFQKYGLAEGRVAVSPYYNEGLYLQKNPDIAAAVQAGQFKSGLQHYIQYGEAEGRSPGAFDEQAYLKLYPDVAAAVKAGVVSSGLQHYIKYGQNESNRVGVFTGTKGNDSLTSFGGADKISYITGVDIAEYQAQANGNLKFSSANFGAGEVDTLTGGAGKDLFMVGTAVQPFGTFSIPQSFYIGNGSDDYAVIKNFEVGKDAISLGGYSSVTYRFEVVDNNLNISSATGDLVAKVEGVTSLSQLPGNNTGGTFLMG